MIFEPTFVTAISGIGTIWHSIDARVSRSWYCARTPPSAPGDKVTNKDGLPTMQLVSSAASQAPAGSNRAIPFRTLFAENHQYRR
jgi:hypothetical protein